MEQNRMKEALFWKSEGKNIRCELCPHKCLIPNGKKGFCRVRKNIKGKLYSLVYGKPASIAVDPMKKKPLYHFYPNELIYSIGTFGCNMRCLYCQNYEISQETDMLPDYEEVLKDIIYIPPKNIIKQCKEKNLKFIAFTYTEPTVFYEYMLDIAKLAQKEKIKCVMVSNGQINKGPLKKLIKYIDAFNIDLKSFEQKFYDKVCSGFIETTKDTLKLIVKEKKHLEVTYLLIPGYNDNPSQFEQLCEFVSSLGDDVALHITRAFPFYHLDFQPTPIELLKRFEKIAKKHIKNVHVGNV